LVKNETLKREVDELTRALGNVYGGDARLLKCLSSQRFSLNKDSKRDWAILPRKARRPLLLQSLAL
jgi:hypothetical protein